MVVKLVEMSRIVSQPKVLFQNGYEAIIVSVGNSLPQSSAEVFIKYVFELWIFFIEPVVFPFAEIAESYKCLDSGDLVSCAHRLSLVCSLVLIVLRRIVNE